MFVYSFLCVRVHSCICVCVTQDTVEILIAQDLKRAQTYGNRRICFETDEVAELKRFDESG